MIIAVYQEVKLSSNTETHVQSYKYRHGHSPFVHISWFIAKAYLANLYYATRRNVNRTIDACDNVIVISKLSFMNREFAERTFPVVLSTQWTSIYDKEIQQLLGFYSLCSYVLDKCSSRSVYLSVCPVQFALYLRLRVVVDQWQWIKYPRVQIYIGDYDEHIDQCQCMKMIGTGRLCMQLKILRLYSLAVK